MVDFRLYLSYFDYKRTIDITSLEYDAILLQVFLAHTYYRDLIAMTNDSIILN